MGAVAGAAIAPISYGYYNMGTMMGLKGFAAAIVGGLGNFPGSIIAGLLLGVLESFGAGYISSDYKDALAFVILLVVLFVSPQRHSLTLAQEGGGIMRQFLAAQPSLIAALIGLCVMAVVPLFIHNNYMLSVLCFRGHQYYPRRRAEPADGLCRAGIARPCGFFRHRRLCQRDLDHPLSLSPLARHAGRNGLHLHDGLSPSAFRACV